ncbi:MAG: hypothetical protein CVT88_02755 [Candidatus Altiarchaeales archaeon HGW-Altiarchaeales-1]|nr:MAG: hypothetical protein CVT88_02755 [Candidatus Altiarchaeales archaeon HGW-Altiarchaeales-1]
MKNKNLWILVGILCLCICIFLFYFHSESKKAPESYSKENESMNLTKTELTLNKTENASINLTQSESINLTYDENIAYENITHLIPSNIIASSLSNFTNFSTPLDCNHYCFSRCSHPSDDEVYMMYASYGNYSNLSWYFYDDVPEYYVDMSKGFMGLYFGTFAPVHIKKENNTLIIYGIFGDISVTEPPFFCYLDIGWNNAFGFNTDAEKIILKSIYGCIDIEEGNKCIRNLTITKNYLKPKLINGSACLFTIDEIIDKGVVKNITNNSMLIKFNDDLVQDYDWYRYGWRNESNISACRYGAYTWYYDIEYTSDYVRILKAIDGDKYYIETLDKKLNDTSKLLEFLQKETKIAMDNSTLLIKNQTMAVFSNKDNLVIFEISGNLGKIEVFNLSKCDKYEIKQINGTQYSCRFEKSIDAYMSNKCKAEYTKCFDVCYKDDETYGNGTFSLSSYFMKFNSKVANDPIDEIYKYEYVGSGSETKNFHISWKVYGGKTENLCKNKTLYLSIDKCNNPKAVILNAYGINYEDANKSGIRMFLDIFQPEENSNLTKNTKNYTLEINFSKDVDFVEISGSKMCEGDKEVKVYEKVGCKKN